MIEFKIDVDNSWLVEGRGGRQPVSAPRQKARVKVERNVIRVSGVRKYGDAPVIMRVSTSAACWGRLAEIRFDVDYIGR